jgi:hypothetical protein
MSKGEIEIKPDSIYTLIATENKREFVYEGYKIIGTKPYVINFKKNLLINKYFSTVF